MLVGREGVDVEPKNNPFWNENAAYSAMDRLAAGDRFFGAVQATTLLGPVHGGRGVGEDYENPFRTSAIWQNVQSPAAHRSQAAIGQSMRPSVHAAEGQAEQRWFPSPKPSSNMQSQQASPLMHGMVTGKMQERWGVPVDQMSASTGRALSEVPQVNECQKHGLPQPGHRPAYPADPARFLQQHGQDADEPWGFGQTAGTHRDDRPFDPDVLLLDHLKSVHQPVMHTLAPIHQQPPKVLQEMQASVQEQALFAPVYTSSGLRLPRHDQLEVDTEEGPAPLLTPKAASPQGPQTRPGNVNLPYLLPPHSVSPPGRMPSISTEMHSPKHGDHVQQPAESSSDLARVSRGREGAGGGRQGQAAASRLFQAVLMREEGNEEAKIIETRRRRAMIGAFHLPQPSELDITDAAVPKSDTSMAIAKEALPHADGDCRTACLGLTECFVSPACT